MPQLDKTGPEGKGAGTGRGKGGCKSAHGKRFFGHRGCRGFCRGFYNPSKTEEKEMLSQEIEDMREYIKSMEVRLEELGEDK